jgi:selenocysteine lyase/cysteine desulfurase
VWFAAQGLRDDMVRASPHYYNTDDELDRLVAAVRELSAS